MAYTPRYTVKKTIHQSDLDDNGLSYPMAVTGLNNDGLLVGYFSCLTNLHGVPRRTVQAFAWNSVTQQLLNIGVDDLNANASVASCVNDFGAVAGTFWSGGTIHQQGFIWQAGNLTYIDSPDGGNIDAITAINSVGQVTGTYFAASGYYKRAFFWDGYQSIDLGDLGDPDNSFIWPVGITGSRIVGTVYTQGTPYNPPPTTGFRWERENQVMTPLDEAASLLNTTAVAQNWLGQIVGTFQLPPHHGIPVRPSSFYWENDALTELGSFGGGGTSPFALDNTGHVVGTSYASDGTLHLFGWASPAGALADFGVAQISPTDLGFQLTSVNQRGDMAGFVTDAQGQTEVYVRPVGTVAANLSMSALPYNTLDCAPDDANGARVLQDDAGLLAYSGYDHTGEPVVVLLTPDSDDDGLPDGWEMDNFGTLSRDGLADFDGDGIIDLYEYLSGTDPKDYYDGKLPALKIVGGGDQRGAPGTVLPQPLTVRVGSYGQQNAPLTFSVTEGGARLATTANGPTATSVQVRTTATYTDGSGVLTYVAQVWVKLPTANGASTVTITARIGNGTATSVSTTEVASDPTLHPPSAPGLERNSATTMDIHWVPSDPTLPTVAEVSYDAMATWHGVGSFAPGTTSATLYHLSPDHVVYLRLYTAAGGGGGGGGGGSVESAAGTDAAGGSDASDPTRGELLSVPVVEGERAQVKALNKTWLDYTGLTDHRYRHRFVEEIMSLSGLPGDEVSVGHYDHLIEPVVPYTVTKDNQSPIEFDYLTTWTPLSEITGYAFERWWAYGVGQSGYIKENATLSELYTLDHFKADVEGAVPGFPDWHYTWHSDGMYKAWLHFGPASWQADPWFVGPEPTADHSYDVAKLRFKFRCNAEPNGKVVYDVIFVPDDGGAVLHEMHVIETHGKTEVGKPVAGQAEDDPITLDPTALHDKANGVYKIVPIQLQPDDWQDAPDAGAPPADDPESGETNSVSVGEPDDVPVVDDSQRGVIGDMVESTVQGATAQKHFVSTKLSPTLPQSAVRLRAQIPHELEGKFDTYFEWVKPTDKNGNEVGTANGYHFEVPRSEAGRYNVRVRTKATTGTVTDVDSINVWIVWATWDPNQTLNEAKPEWHEGLGRTSTSPLGKETLAYDTDEFGFQANVEPEAIFDVSADIPELRDQPVSKVPYFDYPHVSTKGKYGQPLYKWDITRAVRVRFLTPRLGTNELLNLKVSEDPNNTEDRSTKVLFDGLPSENHIANTCPDPDPATSYPSNPLEGNDNPGELHKGIDPYSTNEIFHANLRDVDIPNQPWLKEKDGFYDSAFEERIHFKEFCRLEIAGTWYLISDPQPWRIHVKLKDRGDRHMRENGSFGDYTNDGW